LTSEPDRFAEYYGRLEGVDARRKAGDVEGARAAMKRLLSIYDKIPADSCARALESLDREFLQDATENPDRTELKVAVDKVAVGLLEMEAAFIRIQVELGDLEATRALIQKGVARLDQIEDVPMASLLLAHYGGELCRAGDPETGRKLIDRGHRELLEIKDEKARPVYFRLLFTLFAHAGQIDSALALLPNLQPAWLEREMSEMIESLADPDSLGPWADFGKVSISIGDPMLVLKNPAQARTTLLRIAEALGGVDNAKVRARLLAIVARLQAVAGDFDGALATANLIPELKRSDYPGPRDGFYDSVRPTAFALVASQLVEAGQQDRALTTFETALKLADAIEPVEERLIAQIAIARELATCGHQAEALELAAGVVPVVSEQTEPRRSRLLGTIADVQTKAGGTDAAWSTIDRIRSWPGVEKASAVIHVAHAEEKAGHLSKADELRRRGLAALASAPAEPDPPADRVLRPTAIGRGFFLDHDTELDPGMVRYDRTRMITTIKVKLGLIDELKADAASLNAFQKGQMLSDAATQLAWKGDYEAAMKMIESIESENGRLSAFNSIAHGLKSETRTR
jgi:tetratricopeptide (TPR) repeat protein